jgi:hypothetical protein
MGTRVDINAILRADPRPCRYGAPMGDRNHQSQQPGVRCYLQRVRFVDGDYGADGTYWGGGPGNNNLWCAFDAPHAEHVRIYVRADNREAAKAAVLEDYPHVVFRR